MKELPQTIYRGRLAPSPTGYLHLGHARTFWAARQRAHAAQGSLILRIEDLDKSRSRPEFLSAILEDLAWFGFSWDEGPDVGGPFGPYVQSGRFDRYRRALDRLQAAGCIYPCRCSRQDVRRSLQAPHLGEDEPIYPGTCRPNQDARSKSALIGKPSASERVNWRFQVPDGETIRFTDEHLGEQSFVAGRDFGDFIVWSHDDVPAYQLAVVVDDAAMQVTEVVRGEDLLRSTARQLLLYRALEWKAPRFYHCPLVTDAQGVRLAKRHDSLSLRALRAKGITPAGIRSSW